MNGKSFAEKAKIYAKCESIYITKPIADYTSFGMKEVNERQKSLAKLAVKTWPI